jgi:hypothetical protein
LSTVFFYGLALSGVRFVFHVVGEGVVRVPLDYYRILGLPIQATADQIQQGHRDRTHQLPRREFSEAAIASRNALMDQAHAVLSDPDARANYDATLLARSYSDSYSDSYRDGGSSFSSSGSSFSNGHADEFGGNGAEREAVSHASVSPTVEIQDAQLIGALLVLLDMGEYELVQSISRPYLTGVDAKLSRGNFGDPQIVTADMALAAALSGLELGREQWQQGRYESAAASLEVGQSVLLRENIFATLRGEIQADLYKLRPYRILELLALPESREAERKEGIGLLESMLQERGGIDGNGDDHSGLNMDDFLRFVQQIRGYLTSSEQQVIFEYESRRPSPVATYLAVYALIARGFAQRQPVLIRRAKSMLGRLGIRQDVHLEQAICALLLGQTDEANRVLELSKEYDSIAFIRENSQDSPDLLPGLCLYTERWLQNEVFPHFRDLAQRQVALKDYFADEDVQDYLEALPNEATEGQWSTVTSSTGAVTTPAREQLSGEPQFPKFETTRPDAGRSVAIADTPIPTVNRDNRDNRAVNRETTDRQRSPNVTTGQSASQSTGQSAAIASGYDKNGRVEGRSSTPSTIPPTAPPNVPPNYGVTDDGYEESAAPYRRNPAFRWDRFLMLIGIGLASVFLLTYLLNQLFGAKAPSTTGGIRTETPNSSSSPSSSAPANSGAGNPSNSANTTGNSPSATGVPLVKSFKLPLDKLAAPSGTAVTSEGTLTTDSAQTIIQTWLAAKTAAMSENHVVEGLPKVLAGDALAEWQSWGNEAKAGNSSIKYAHTNLKIDAVDQDPEVPDEAVIEATLNESKESFASGKSQGDSVSNDLRIRYHLIRQDNQWKIDQIQPF